MISGLSFGEVLIIVAAAVIVFFILGLWAGKKAYGAKPSSETKKKRK
jgi:FtsZ-interacting cell division protein ZipA